MRLPSGDNCTSLAVLSASRSVCWIGRDISFNSDSCTLSLANTPTEAEPGDAAVVGTYEVAAHVFHGRIEGEHLVVVDEGQPHRRWWRRGRRRVLVGEAAIRRDLHR